MAVDNVKLFKAIHDRAKKELTPKLKVGPKRAFKLHAMINWLLNLFYPKDQKDAYYKSYSTTIGNGVAMAESAGDDVSKFGNWQVLCHEIKHVLQAMKWTRPLFFFLYLWPISQGIVFLLFGWIGAIWVPGWWKALYLGLWLVTTGIHFIPQLPDPWRQHWEFQGYSISMHLYALVYGNIDQNYINRVVKNFHSMAYFIMAPNEKKIRNRVVRLSHQILIGKSPVKDEPIVKIAEEEDKKLAA